MFRKHVSRRGGVVAAAAVIGLSGMSLAFAGGTAGANPVVSSTINGSGSNTTYQMMIGLSDLFDQAPGCNLGSGVPEPLDLSCVVPYLASTPLTGVSGTTWTAASDNYSVGQTVSLSGTGVTATDLAGTVTPTGDFSVASATGTTFTLNDLSGKLVTWFWHTVELHRHHGRPAG